MVHHERSAHDGAVRICRVENFCYHKPAWAELCFGIVQDCVSQAFGEPAVLFKDKVNYKGPGGGGLHREEGDDGIAAAEPKELQTSDSEQAQSVAVILGKAAETWKQDQLYESASKRVSTHAKKRVGGPREGVSMAPVEAKRPYQ